MCAKNASSKQNTAKPYVFWRWRRSEFEKTGFSKINLGCLHLPSQANPLALGALLSALKDGPLCVGVAVDF